MPVWLPEKGKQPSTSPRQLAMWYGILSLPCFFTFSHPSPSLHRDSTDASGMGGRGNNWFARLLGDYVLQRAGRGGMGQEAMHH
ncbi:uncharacterized protein SPSK_10936 [Sporothrix schenckii 1099-18]|uniref:Uncharacterized protein n=1 Tax=Sporothrix schenckii 1099-18 TaxID=1397361 RepID=A0A0F2M7Z5_SPOSC|nr:uncharacterized protein SPSK_10936 [Sporothrix schenckii 1099-18]KJR85204.1 hypothetical protein SPSK_10936 [Sporothrix schenckii 1099-18]